MVFEDQIIKIVSVDIKDVRFPARSGHGSDVMHTDPNYSCAYVILRTNTVHEGYGMTFTLGRGTEIVVAAIKALSYIIVDQNVSEIFGNFSQYWRRITSESQLRWLGPEKGVMHLAAAAFINALWDLWARIEDKPIWKLLTSMDPKLLVSTIDFRYLSDILTKEEALKMLEDNESGKKEREAAMITKGYPAYTTQVGWLGYSDEEVEKLCQKYLAMGFRGFKVKVGDNLQDDIRRCGIVRKVIGWDNYFMIDANQIWDVQQAIDWVKQLSEFKPHWIEEPTSPDDILGHLAISKALNPLGIKVACGEMCSNRVMFKQFLQSSAIQICQIDSCRVGSINEILPVYMIAKKLNIAVCPHSGGVGLCEMVQHLQFWDYISLGSEIRPGQFIEHIDDENEHFTTKLNIQNAHYVAPQNAGYGVRFKDEILQKYEYPCGQAWT